jgi:pSer/pThr/pTyr-binding forkhead associated (FHA) protein
MPFQLVVVQGRSRAKVVRLGSGSSTMGRQQGCQVRINSSQVSRKHCELFEKLGHLLVKDLGSSNGTFVNGKKINQQQVLEIGDELSVGPIRFRIEKLDAAAKPAEQPAGAAQAVAGAAAVASASPDDAEYEITFDDESGEGATQLVTDATAHSKPVAKPAAQPAAAAPAAPAPAPAAAAPAPAAAEPSEPEDAPVPEMGDDAVADFLLGIELDDDDKV